MSRSPLEGVGKQRNSKIEKSKIENRKNRKPEFLDFAKREEKAETPKIARACLTTIAEAKKGIPLGGISIPPLTALYWL
jgi:hypothetical protein